MRTARRRCHPAGRALAVFAALLVLGGCGERPGGAGRSDDTGAAPDTTSVPADTAPPPARSVRLTGYDTVFVYFTNRDEEQVPRPRPVPDTADALRAAFAALLRGPTAGEREDGLLSWFSGETAGMLRSAAVVDGFAVVDFQDLRPVIPNAVGSAGALMLMGELTATAFQFPGIRRVELRIEGSCDALMAWLQFGCTPITRSGWDPPPTFRTAVRGSRRP